MAKTKGVVGVCESEGRWRQISGLTNRNHIRLRAIGGLCNFRTFAANGVGDAIVIRTDEGSPQGGKLSPLLANIYLDKFDKEFESRGVKVIRYAKAIGMLRVVVF